MSAVNVAAVPILVTQTGDRLRATDALLSELLREAIGAERLLVTRSELLSDEHLVAAGARETLAVPRGAFVRDSSLVDYLHPDATKNVSN